MICSNNVKETIIPEHDLHCAMYNRNEQVMMQELQMTLKKGVEVKDSCRFNSASTLQYMAKIQEVSPKKPSSYQSTAIGTDLPNGEETVTLKRRLDQELDKDKGWQTTHTTTKRYMPVEKSSASKKPERQIPTGHRIFSNVRLRWIPTGKLLNSCTGKVDSEPAHGSRVDIPHIHACKQTLGLSAAVQASVVNVKWRLLKITLQAPFLNVQKTFDRSRSSLVLHQMTSDHNRSELGIQDHSNEQSSSKLVPKVVP
ncbi:hypothetical protein Tco_0892001 [Tanacetum coccineum]|uniref:Uncharacterized protein n=1 Tax=Tanacetum coccineum TaxID=301880 RepID=A0ABQ5C9Z6_9ASTR